MNILNLNMKENSSQIPWTEINDFSAFMGPIQKPGECQAPRRKRGFKAVLHLTGRQQVLAQRPTCGLNPPSNSTSFCGH